MTDPVHISLQPLGATLAAPRGAPLRDLLFRYGVEFPCGGKGRCRGCRVKVLSGDAPAGPAHQALLSAGEIAAGWRLACQLRAESDMVLELAQWEVAILGDASRFEFIPAEGFGIAIDLGTTTLVAQLVDLATGAVLAVETALNPQVRFGSDVMSRVEHALTPGGAAELRHAIREALGSMAARLCGARAAARVAIVGNTAMHHLFCGLDVGPLARAPFETHRLDARLYRESDLAWDLPGDPEIRFLACAGGFVGSDVVAGAAATGVGEGSAPEGLIDLGTNGEIVFGAHGRLLCASTAAGPAFEGVGIRCGMRASTGAIAEVSAENGVLRCRVLGGGRPRGICGSGLVDAVAAGLALGLIQPNGRLANSGPLALADTVVLEQRDIRALQLAKAAIAAGAEIVRARLGAPECPPLAVHLAGAFGNYINRASAAAIGLLEFAPDLIRPAGNTALLGAKMALFSPGFDCARFEAVRRRMEHVPLASDARFEDTYVAKMSFPAP